MKISEIRGQSLFISRTVSISTQEQASSLQHLILSFFLCRRLKVNLLLIRILSLLPAIPGTHVLHYQYSSYNKPVSLPLIFKPVFVHMDWIYNCSLPKNNYGYYCLFEMKYCVVLLLYCYIVNYLASSLQVAYFCLDNTVLLFYCFLFIIFLLNQKEAKNPVNPVNPV